MLSDRQAFALTLRELARFHAKELDDRAIRDYWDTLSPRLDDASFAAACEALQTGEWWPSPARILRAAEIADSFERQAAVMMLYSAICGCDEAGPQGGTMYRLTTIEVSCGELAARLVRAVGGAYAFERAMMQPNDEPFLRKAFLEAARDLYRAEPETICGLVLAHQRALPATRRALGSGDVAQP